jgi:hypothetical protein
VTALQPSSAKPAAAPVQKQRINVYTMMLILSFIALVTACILMYMELQSYGTYPWWKTDRAKPSTLNWQAPHVSAPGTQLAFDPVTWRKLPAGYVA